MVDQDEERRELYRGFGSGYSRAFEMVAALVLLAGLGFFLDGRLGTKPVLTVVFGFFAAVGTFVKLYYQYKADMEAIEARSPWAPRPSEPADREVTA